MAPKATHEILRMDGLELHITRKNIKNMYLRVTAADGSLQINAPIRMPEKEIIRFVETRRQWIMEALERVKEKEAKNAERSEPTQEEAWKDWTYLKEELAKLIAHWAPVMGVKPGGFKIRKMKSRWGSCNVKTHHMTFNLELARVPYECMEYVVVHELSHLIEPSHNEHFWRTMETYLPEAKLLRKRLKEYCR